jgi:hypothetical protein
MIISRKLSLSIGILLSFNLLLVNYFFNFNEGNINSGTTIRFFFKILSVLLICNFFKNKKPSPNRINKLLLLFFIFSSFLIIIRLPFLSSIDKQFINVYLTLPILLGFGPNNDEEFNEVDRLILLSFGFCFLLDTYLLFTSSSIWSSGAFIGGVGNPSSYGFILIYIYEVAIKIIRKKSIRFYIRLLVVISLFLTQALMPILLFFLLQFIKLKKKYLFTILFSFFVLFSKIEYFLEFLPDAYWKYKLVKLIEFSKDLDVSNASKSISVRIDFFESVNFLFLDLYSFLFGGVNNTYYNFGDSQIVTYITSFGIPLFILFVISIFGLYFKSRNTKLKYFVISLILILFTNRILDYWPVPVLIFLVFNRSDVYSKNNNLKIPFYKFKNTNER